VENKKKYGIGIFSCFGMYLISRAFDYCLENLLNISNTVTISIGFLIFLFTIIVGLVILLVYQIKKGNDTPYDKPVKHQKPLPWKFEIDTINEGKIEWIVLVKRSWYPYQKPDIWDFLTKLSLSKPICSLCKSEFIKERSPNFTFYYCSNDDCESRKEKPYREKYISKKERFLFGKFKGDIRSNGLGKYWNIYVEKYDRATQKKYDEFYKPSG